MDAEAGDALLSAFTARRQELLPYLGASPSHGVPVESEAGLELVIHKDALSAVASVRQVDDGNGGDGDGRDGGDGDGRGSRGGGSGRGKRRRADGAPSPEGAVTVVMTDTTQRNLRGLGFAVCQRAAVLVEGANGSGKTCLVRELARRAGQIEGLVELHLDDQMDSKTLVGSYVCTDTPGEFKWQAGALTRAVQEGRWVVIEDIDRAPFEVLSSLVPLLERRVLLVAGRGEVIEAAPTFRLFATRATQGSFARRGAGGRGGGMDPNVEGFLRNRWLRVEMASLRKHELATVLSARCGDLGVGHIVAGQMLDTFLALVPDAVDASEGAGGPAGEEEGASAAEGMELETKGPDGQHDDDARSDDEERDGNSDDNGGTSSSEFAGHRVVQDAVRCLETSGRRCGVRELLKWGARVGAWPVPLAASGFLTEDQRMNVVAEAIDVFGGHLPRPADRSALADALALMWKVTPEAVGRQQTVDKPHVDEAPTTRNEHNEPCLAVGRALLPSREDVDYDAVGATSFAQTGSVCRLMERLAVCASSGEPVLVVGETGCGKTTVIQQLAAASGRRLIVQNMNVQSESGDLLGGFRPVEMRQLVVPVHSNFVDLFRRTFPTQLDSNKAFLLAVSKYMERRAWRKVIKAFRASLTSVADALTRRSGGDGGAGGGGAGRARRGQEALEEEWAAMTKAITRLEQQRRLVADGLAFSFVEGALVEAVKKGHWMLLDEINLAPAEVHDRLAGLLEHAGSSIALTERGDVAPLKRHPDFRLFAAMNPATDVGKKDLMPGVRGRFTELYVDEVTDETDLAIIVREYLSDTAKPPVKEIVDFYLAARQMSDDGTITTGDGRRARYSLRTLCRALEANRGLQRQGHTLDRALYESLSMSFLTNLNHASAEILAVRIRNDVCKKRLKARDLKKAPTPPGGKEALKEYVLVESFYVKRGPEELYDAANANAPVGTRFVLTPSVSTNLHLLTRAVAAGKYPILLQGPTSSGKTSIVTYLAARLGHHCVRINNHEHTDLQEYLGSYVTDTSGKLVFQEGALVQAVRRGHWIILDELNLAPSDVLEALNRLLDSNRELFIPETMEIVKPHPNFLLFATQNPAGAYGGRKELSRAFRNRFLELFVDDIKMEEMSTILVRDLATC